MEFIQDKKLNFLFEVLTKSQVQKNIFISEVEFKQLNIQKIDKNLNLEKLEQIKIIKQKRIIFFVNYFSLELDEPLE